MAGDFGVAGDRMPKKKSILDKYDVPLHHLDFEYVKNCRNVRELEKILKILRSREEGYYPELTVCVENQLAALDSKNSLLRKETKAKSKADLSKEEWSSITSDLLAWKGDLDRVDAKMAEQKSYNTFNGQVPSVRRSIKGFQNKKNGDISEKKSQRIKGSDYNSWDKFDADEECKKMDLEQEIKEESTKKIEEIQLKENKKMSIEELAIQSLGDIGNLPHETRESTALREKDIGNEFYNTNNIDESIKHYTRSVYLYPTVAGLNNRAAAYLKQCAFNKALVDLNKVLEMDPTNVKARFRRAQSFQHKNSFREALDDIHHVLLKEPNNHVARHVADQLRESMRKLPKMHRIRLKDRESGKMVVKTVTQFEMLNDYKNENFIEVNNFGLPKIMCNCDGKHSHEAGIRHEDHVRYQHVRTHVPKAEKVVKTNSEKSDLEKLLTTNPPAKKLEIVEVEKNVKDDDDWNDTSEMVPLFGDAGPSSCVVADMRTKSFAPMESDGKSKKMGENELIKDACSSSDLTKEVKTGKNITIKEKCAVTGFNESYPLENGIDTHPQGNLPNGCGCVKPLNLFQFKRDWSAITGNSAMERKAELLFSICPSHVVQAFGNSWDKDMLVDVMKCLLLQDDPQTRKKLSEYVHALPKLDRFNINYYFLSQEERSLAQELIDRCRPYVDSKVAERFQLSQ